MKELEQALMEYAFITQGKARMPEFVAQIKRIDDIQEYVKSLRGAQLEGKEQLFGAYRSATQEQTAVELQLFWNPQAKYLELNWKD